MVFGRFVKKINPCVKNLSTSPCLKKRNRTKQRAFREKLIEIYEKCPLDNVNPKLCEAAHILPFSDCKKRKINIILIMVYYYLVICIRHLILIFLLLMIKLVN